MKTISSIGLSTLIILSLSVASFGQTVDSVGFNQFKDFLPFVLKNVKSIGETSAPLSERVQDKEFVAPWDLEQFSQSEIDQFVEILSSSTEYKLKETRSDYENVSLISTLQNFRTNPELDKRFRNLTIFISNHKLVNNNGDNVYKSSKQNILQPKNEDQQRITMQGAQFSAYVPVDKGTQNLSGSVDLSLVENENFSHTKFSIEDKLGPYNLNGQDIELIKLDGEYAIFRVNKPIEGIKFVSTNKENKKHNQSSVFSVPEDIYLKGLEENLTEEDIKSFADNYSYELFSNKERPHFMIFRASGILHHVYAYQITSTSERGKCTLNFKL